MIFKFIDARGHTHFRECSQVAYVGSSEAGWAEALRYDGEAGEVLHYDVAGDGEFDQPTRYFVIVPLEGAGRREVIATSCVGAWLMSDKGRTIENLLALTEPRFAGDVPARVAVPLP